MSETGPGAGHVALVLRVALFPRPVLRVLGSLFPGPGQCWISIVAPDKGLWGWEEGSPDDIAAVTIYDSAGPDHADPPRSYPRITIGGTNWPLPTTAPQASIRRTRSP